MGYFLLIDILCKYLLKTKLPLEIERGVYNLRNGGEYMRSKKISSAEAFYLVFF